MAVYPSLAERVFGLRPPFEDSTTMASQAYNTLMGEQADIERLFAQNEHRLAQIERRVAAVGLAKALYELEQDTLEITVTLNTLKHVFTDRGAAYGTVLGALPLYHALYLKHAGLTEPEGARRRALLAGSIAPISSAAFVALSEYVFRADPWIADPIDGRYKRRHGNFIQDNALSLPDDWLNSTHVVVTNRLLHMLLGTDGSLVGETLQSEQRATRAFAQAMFGILQAGGHLVLCEQPPQLDMQDFWCEGGHNRSIVAAFDKNMRAVLAETGFSSIHITTGWETGSADFLFQPFNLNVPATPRVERLGSLAIYAQKPFG